MIVAHLNVALIASFYDADGGLLASTADSRAVDDLVRARVVTVAAVVVEGPSPALTEEVFVDELVTVVILAVTDLEGGLRPLTEHPTKACADRDPRTAADPFKVVRAWLTVDDSVV